MSYSAGNLELSILGFSEKAVASIDVTAKALRKLASSIDKINNTQFVLAGQKMEVLFTKIAQATNSIDTKNISNLAIAAKSLSSISKIGNLEKVDFTKVGNGFRTLATSISPFIDKVKEAETSLNALYGILKKNSGKTIGNVLNGSNSKSSSKGINFADFLNIGKWGAVLFAAKRLGGYVAQIVQHGADYTETLNLWETSMSKNITVATEFVNKMNEAYGISEKTLMNAQAIFKNMLGSLGQISDQMAYALSEGVTQMALDYASLYNVTFKQAFTKFQAALAGQVRPIRSVSGYDITENTLFQLYQSLGGEKTMRQLSRTEKQLLSIYAIFKQMDASGAIGDLDKTMESFANQSRVWAESWQRVMTYSGVILTHIIEQSGLMTYLNAVLIFLGDTFKAVAESMGAIKSFADPFESTTEGALDAGEAIDEVKGKLLGFDKFRSLSGESNNVLGIDEKLLKALSGFNSILDGASMDAKILAEQLKVASGLFTEDGVFNKDRWEELVGNIEAVGEAILIAFGVLTISKISDFIQHIDWAKTSIDLLNLAIEGMALYYLVQAIEAFQEGDYWAGIFKTAIGVGLVGAFLLLKNAIMIDGIPCFDLFGKTLNGNFLLIGSGILMLIGGIGDFISNFDKLSDGAKIWIPILATLAGVIAAVVAGLTFMSGNWIGAIGLGAMIAGIGLSVGTALSIPQFAEGGLPDKGTMFVAGEAGAEMVYNMPSGQSGVANIRQIEQAMYNALERHSANGGDPIVIQAYLDGEKVYENTTARAKSRGNIWAKA